MKCTDCGSEGLIEGTILGSDGSGAGFYPNDIPTIKRFFALGSRAVRAYGCIHCHNLQLAVEFTESDSEQYRQFEGQQPELLKRINSE
jgi:hypothetical protein